MVVGRELDSDGKPYLLHLLPDPLVHDLGSLHELLLDETVIRSQLLPSCPIWSDILLQDFQELELRMPVSEASGKIFLTDLLHLARRPEDSNESEDDTDIRVLRLIDSFRIGDDGHHLLLQRRIIIEDPDEIPIRFTHLPSVQPRDGRDILVDDLLRDPEDILPVGLIE